MAHNVEEIYKLVTSPDVLRVLEQASYRYGFCPVTESCNGCTRCEEDYQLLSQVINTLTVESKRGA